MISLVHALVGRRSGRGQRRRIGGVAVLVALILFATAGPGRFAPHRAAARQTSLGVPRSDPGYGADVERWWSAHPMNPESDQFVPADAIRSPEPRLDVSADFDRDIQAAIDALPASGGTLLFTPGTYQHNFRIVGRGNIHFLATDDGVSIVGGISPGEGATQRHGFFTEPGFNGTIASCELAQDYGLFDRAVSTPSDPDHEAAFTCIRERQGNVYFRGITFDGGGHAVHALRIAAYRDVLFDDVTFMNFVNPGSGHPGLVFGHEVIDNVWVRGSTFEGRSHYATYFDGCHNCGVVGSRIESAFSGGGLLWLTNADFTQDYNQDGDIEPSEYRSSAYVAVVGNSFGGSHTLVSATADHVLIADNTADRFSSYIANFDVRNHRTDRHDFVNLKVVRNVLPQVEYLAQFGGPTCFRNDCETGDATGRYTVRDNVVKDAAGFVQPVVLDPHSGPQVGPNEVSDNCVGGTYWGTTTTCGETPPSS